METFMQTILQISISMAAVIGLLLLLVPIWQQRYSARWRKVIWLVIAIRLLVPFSLELPEAPVVMDVNLEEQTGFTVPVQEAARTENRYDTAAVTENQAVTVKPEARNYAETTMESTVPVMVQKQEPVSYGTILFAVWILGLAVFVIWHGVQYVMFGRKVFASALPLEDGDWLRNNAGADMNLHRLPDVLISAEVQSPMLTGFKKPVIVLPERIYGEQELLLILRHELMHYKHHDLWYKLILLAANAVHWFNPLVYLMLRQAGRDVEQVCDDAVTAGQDMAYRKAYSMTILNTMANQKGVALSTCLSKDAQNVKNRFAGILQPKQYKRGAAVFLGVVLLAVAASGCLQIGEKDAGVEAYEQIAEFLPEDAIHDPNVYEVIGEADDEYLMYIWIEGAYEVTAEEAKEARLNDGALSYGRDGKDYLYDRALVMWVSQEDGHIATMGYDNRTMDNVKPSEIGRDKEKRDKYVQRIAKTLINDGENLTFKEQNIASDTDGNAIRGTYTTGTMADIEMYAMRLNYQHGYLEQFMYYGPDAWTQGKVSREYDITIEGMTETVELTMNRRPDYYVLFADAERFNSQTDGEMIEGCFTDKYVLAGDDETTPVKTYMAVSYTPDCTMEEWRQTEKTGKTYACVLPQIQQGDEWTPGWNRTGQTKIFPEDPNRIWQVLKPAKEISGISNICYATSYRGGVMAMYISYPDAYAEGWGSRMHAMADTLVLAAREDTEADKKEDSKKANAVYKQVAKFLPEDAIHKPEQFQKTGGENNTVGYLWVENPYEVTEEETYGKGIMCLHKNGKHYLYERALLVYVDEETGRIVSYDYDRKEEKPEKMSEIAGKNIWQKQEYVQKTIRPLIEGDELLFCDYRKANQSYVTSAGVQKYRAVPAAVSDDSADGYFISENTANDYQYLVKLNYDYGYIEELYSWYHNENLAAQVENWLAVEYTRLHEEYYDINGFEAAIAEEALENGKYTVSLNFTMNYRNKGTVDENTYLNQLKAAGSPDYQQLYEDYEKPQQSIANLKIEAPLLDSKQLSVQGIRLYTAIDGAAGSMHWQEIPGLYVFLKDGEREVAGWSKEKTAVLWAADNYLQAYVSQDAEGMERYSTIESITTESQYLAGKGYASLEPSGQNFRAHLVEQFQKEYGGNAAVHPDTTVKLCLTLKTYNYYYGEDYLYLTLQKEGKTHWVVTDAYVEEFRI